MKKRGVVEICPEDELGVHYLKGNLGNSMVEISRYFARYHNIKRVNVKNPSKGEKVPGVGIDGIVSKPEKNRTKNVFSRIFELKIHF